MTYTIEYGIPLPPAKRGTTRRDRHRAFSPLSETMLAMGVGGSFEVETEAEYRNAMGRMTHFRPRRYAVRKLDGVWRIWRTE